MGGLDGMTSESFGCERRAACLTASGVRLMDERDASDRLDGRYCEWFSGMGEIEISLMRDGVCNGL